LESNGNSYEELFTNVMQQCNPNFRQVKPQGSWGDKKNDGFDEKTGTYYQVYAPENLSSTENNAITKLVTDFNGLLAFWPNIGFTVKKFYYVLNDKFKGVGPALYANIAKLRDANSDIKIDIFDSKRLQDIFDSLDECKMQNVIGAIPSSDSSMLTIDAIHTAVKHIMDFKSVALSPFIPKDPNMQKKIEFNNLSEHLGDLMFNALIGTRNLEEYFSNENGNQIEILRDIFNTFYQESLLQNFNNSDEVFIDIYNKASPKDATKAVADAVMALMAYFFESCDIFKSPENDSTY